MAHRGLTHSYIAIGGAGGRGGERALPDGDHDDAGNYRRARGQPTRLTAVKLSATSTSR